MINVFSICTGNIALGHRTDFASSDLRQYFLVKIEKSYYRIKIPLPNSLLMLNAFNRNSNVRDKYRTLGKIWISVTFPPFKRTDLSLLLSESFYFSTLSSTQLNQSLQLDQDLHYRSTLPFYFLRIPFVQIPMYNIWLISHCSLTMKLY